MSYADKMHRFAQETRQEEHDRASRYMKGFRTFAETVKASQVSAAELAGAMAEASKITTTAAEAQKNMTSGFLATLARACGIRPKQKEN